MILGGSRTIAIWPGKAGNGVRPILLSVGSLYVPYCFPAVLILMQTQKLERPRPREQTRIDLYTTPKRTNTYRFIYRYRLSTSTRLRLGRDSINHVIGHTLPYCSPIPTNMHTKSCARRTSLKELPPGRRRGPLGLLGLSFASLLSNSRRVEEAQLRDQSRKVDLKLIV